MCPDFGSTATEIILVYCFKPLFLRWCVMQQESTTILSFPFQPRRCTHSRSEDTQGNFSSFNFHRGKSVGSRESLPSTSATLALCCPLGRRWVASPGVPLSSWAGSADSCEEPPQPRSANWSFPSPSARPHLSLRALSPTYQLSSF